MRILITGASGFVGRALTDHLMAQGHEVTGHSRRVQSDFPNPCLACDFSDTKALSTALTKTDHVIHAAGRKSGTRVGDFMRDNADLPVHLFQLAQQAGVQGFTQLSSATALLDLSAKGQSDMPETQAANCQVPWAYARAKALAEHRLIEAAKRGGTRLHILRPCLIWGGQAFFHTRLKNGNFRRIGQSAHGHTTVHIDTLTDFIAHSLRYEGPQQVFHPQDAGQLPFDQFLTQLSTRLSAPVPGLVPPPLASALAGMLGAARRLSGNTQDYGFQGVRALFGHAFTTSDALSREALNWQPPLSVAAAMERVS